MVVIVVVCCCVLLCVWLFDEEGKKKEKKERRKTQPSSIIDQGLMEAKRSHYRITHSMKILGSTIARIVTEKEICNTPVKSYEDSPAYDAQD